MNLKIEKLDFTTLLLITLITELLFLYSFRFTKLPFTGKDINNWYSKFGILAIILDILSVLIGFYLGKFLYIYLRNKNIIVEKNNNINLLAFLIIILGIQITHDFLFYFLVILKTKKGNNTLIDEFKTYSKNVGVGAVIGDSSMYIMSIVILYCVHNLNYD